MDRRRQLVELEDLFNDPRSSAEPIESGPGYVLVNLICKGAIRLVDGRIELAERHRIRFVTSPEHPGAALPIYEPERGVPWHPNIRAEAPHIVCADLANQVSRRGLVPLISTANLVYEILTGNEWSAQHGVFNAEALTYFATLQADGKLPLDTRRLI